MHKNMRLRCSALLDCEIKINFFNENKTETLFATNGTEKVKNHRVSRGLIVGMFLQFPVATTLD